MDSNCKTKFNLDHVYCHPSDGNYIRANSGPTEVVSILKENKQLKAMLLLHLDLIQEQSDQLMAKEKQIANLREENSALKLRLERSDRRMLKNKVPLAVDPINCLPPPASNEVEVKTENDTTVKAQPAGRITSPAMSPTDHKESSPPAVANSTDSTYKICDDTGGTCIKTEKNVIGENNGKLITKIYLQRVQTPDKSPRPGSAASDEAKQDSSEKCDPMPKASSSGVVKRPVGVPPRKRTKSVIARKDNDTAAASGADEETTSSEKEDKSKPAKLHKKPFVRPGIMTTTRRYTIREWEDEKVDADLNREESEALKSENPNLEIPKWRVREFHGLYTIEGTEDLSDEVFLKRHNKLEIEEKRRKKWDIQRIREQRTIERLKRRHMKEETVQEPGSSRQQYEKSFFPSPESIKFIQISDELPVNAFGECIPLLEEKQFSLPWSRPHSTTTDHAVISAVATASTSKSPNPTASTSTAGCSSGPSSSSLPPPPLRTLSGSVSVGNFAQSSFLVLKKRRRQTSQTAMGPKRSYRRSTAAKN